MECLACLDLYIARIPYPHSRLEQLLYQSKRCQQSSSSQFITSDPTAYELGRLIQIEAFEQAARFGPLTVFIALRAPNISANNFAFPILSALPLHRTSHMPPARLAAGRHGKRTFAESESANEGIRHPEPSPIKRKSALRQSLDATLALRMEEEEEEDPITERMLKHLRDIAASTDQLTKEMITAQDNNNRIIEVTDRRLDQIQTSMTHTNEQIQALNEKFDCLACQRRHDSPPPRRPSAEWPLDHPNSPGGSGAASTEVPRLVNTSSREERFRDSDIGYFDPKSFEPDEEGDYVTAGDKVHYRNVWLFIESAKSTANVKGMALVRANLHHCLKNLAQKWYIGELSSS